MADNATYVVLAPLIQWRDANGNVSQLDRGSRVPEDAAKDAAWLKRHTDDGLVAPQSVADPLISEHLVIGGQRTVRESILLGDEVARPVENDRGETVAPVPGETVKPARQATTRR